MDNFESLLSIIVIWRGNKYVVEMNPDASLKNLGDELQKLTDVKPDTMRLFVPQISSKCSKLLSPYSKEHSELSLQKASIVEGKSIRMMGVSEDEVNTVLQNAEDHLRIAGFDEEERRMRQRMSSRSNALLKLPQGPYTFCDFRTLELSGIELNPPASEALKRMHMLAADPGIVAIMNKHCWRVGIMTEMAPVGYVGVSPKCILGFNKNHGEEISLRLRTDDLKGFRKYESIKKTLLHELAHMVFSEHDANFFALDYQLNQEAVKLDWTKSRGHTLGAVRNLDYDEEDYDASDKRYVSQKLGGNASDQLASASESSVAAAFRRLIEAEVSRFNPEVSGVHEEPVPDDSRCSMHERHDNIDYVREAYLDDDSSSEVQLKQDYEPDPDDRSCDPSNCEPDPDDSQSNHHQVMDTLNHGIQLSKAINEPDLDDLEAKHIKSIYRNIHLEGYNVLVNESMEDRAYNAYKEPDPDESETKRIVQAEPDPDDDLMVTPEISGIKIHETMALDEPDPNDSEAKLISSGNGYIYEHCQKNAQPSESIENAASSNRARMEPGPDESRTNGVGWAEPDPENGLVGSQETSNMPIDEPDPDDQELQRIQDPVTVICNRLNEAVEMLRSEVDPTEASTALQTLFKIIRNVIEHPNETKFKKLRKANRMIQMNVAKYKGAMEILQTIGFVEEAVFDGSGIADTYLVLKRNDVGLLWLAKSCLEGYVSV
ncbi:uncharacterized protein [Euphorbia lathyris]|uniref:uncharacterized protein n=1 Tax=Euphorbia lathyris TaxID=212925 RepID=UPI0033131FF0